MTIAENERESKMTLRVFIGFDHRQPIAFTTLMYSIMKHASAPIQVTPLILSTLPIDRQGLTPFTFSRFLVPWLCDFEGVGIFLDADMLVLDDILQLGKFVQADTDVMVSKNLLQFEWSSVMVFNCARCRLLTPSYVQSAKNLHSMTWATSIGDLPARWNHLVGYDAPNSDVSLVHFTQGLPCFPETHASEHGDSWRLHAREAMSARSWAELMGNSVHAAPVRNRLASTP